MQLPCWQQYFHQAGHEPSMCAGLVEWINQHNTVALQLLNICITATVAALQVSFNACCKQGLPQPTAQLLCIWHDDQVSKRVELATVAASVTITHSRC